MKTSAFFLAALFVATLLLSSCGNSQSTETGATADTTAAADSAAGPDHSQMHHGAAAPDMMGLMHGMMQNMDNLRTAGNTDHDFAHMMMAHHKGAVEMSALELKEGKDATLRAMAEKISADQQQEILALEEIATRLDAAPANYKPEDPADPFTSKMKASMDVMMTNMAHASGNVDQDYVALMLPHHQSAVDMAKAELAHGRDTRLKQLAQQMITAQEQEIKQFKAWQAKNGGEAQPGAATYECPMGDSAPSNAPGKCPKCGMNLEKKA